MEASPPSNLRAMYGLCAWVTDRYSASPSNCGRNLRTPRPAPAPRWPDLEFPRTIPKKKTPRTEILEPQENAPKIPKNMPKIPVLVFWECFFRCFRGILGVNSGSQSGSPEFRAVFFLGIFVEVPGRASRRAVAGQGVLKSKFDTLG